MDPEEVESILNRVIDELLFEPVVEVQEILRQNLPGSRVEIDGSSIFLFYEDLIVELLAGSPDGYQIISRPSASELEEEFFARLP